MRQRLDERLDRAVAVKFPHRGRLGANDVEKFLREARAAAQHQHALARSDHLQNLVERLSVRNDHATLLVNQ